MHYPIIIILGISNRGNPRAKTTTQTGLMGIFVSVSSLMHDDTIGALTSIRLPLWGWMVFARKKRVLFTRSSKMQKWNHQLNLMFKSIGSSMKRSKQLNAQISSITFLFCEEISIVTLNRNWQRTLENNVHDWKNSSTTTSCAPQRISRGFFMTHHQARQHWTWLYLDP